MSFSLHAHERPADGLLRILLSQLNNVQECVANDGRLTDKEIHNARKAIKRGRATLRMLRPALHRSVFKQTNLALRDVARPLTYVRDAKVLIDALEALREHFGEAAECLSTDEFEHDLQIRRARSRREISSTATSVTQLRGAIRKIESEVKQWHLRTDGWHLIGPALERIYREARRAHARVLEARSDERLHEWRKQVKHYWHALQILTPIRAGWIGEMADQAHKLTEYLGDDHDLAVLRSQVATADIDEDMLEVLEALIDKRRSDLQDRAFAVGERMFDAKAKRLIETIKPLWRAWRASPPPVPTRESLPKSRTSTNGSTVQLH
jgi:CHAD domain-containing protein